MSTSLNEKANKTLFVTLLLVAGLGVAQAASLGLPGATPPGGAAVVPITATTTPQLKTGALKVAGTIAPAAGVALEVGDSAGATGGFLLPRVTTVQREALAPTGTNNPALLGLTVYNTQLKQPEIFNGTNWIASSASTTATVDGPSFFAYLSQDAITPGTGWFDLGAIGDFTPQASFQAGEFAVPSGDFNSATGVFQPSVPGKYVLSFLQWYAQGAAICKNGAIPTTAGGGAVPQGCVVGWGTTYGGKVTAVFDANGTTDYFKTYVYANSGDAVRGAATHYTHFSGSRIGNPVIVIRQDNAVHYALPSGAVQFFNRGSCPPSWTLMDGNNSTINMQGMYIVGASGAPNTVGALGAGESRLTDLENRVTGAHSHTIPSLTLNAFTLPAETYTAVVSHWFGYYYVNQDRSDVLGRDYANSYISENAIADTTSGSTMTGATTDGGVTGAAGTFAGTNAPYVQFLACQKN